MQTLQEAKTILHDVAKAYKNTNQSTEILPLLQAQNRILAQDIYAQKSLPSFDNSAMDGYALNVKDANKILKIQTSIFAGDSKAVTLEPRACAKIMTGAKIPQGANCVVPFESIEGGFGNTTQITAPKDLKSFANIRREGEEVLQNSLLLMRGTQLSCDTLTLLATQGISNVHVFMPLSIAIFTSGNELKEPWEEANSYQIYNSNATMVQSTLHSLHFNSKYCGILKDNLSAINGALQSSNDVIFTTGGASKGEADFMRKALEQNGATLLVDGVDIKPGKPIMIAHLKEKFIIALPGNPLAGNVMLRVLILPFLQELSGANAYYPNYITLKAKTSLKKKARTEALLAKIEKDCVSFIKNGKYGSGEVTPMAQSDALVILDSDLTEIKEGDMLKVLPFYAPFSTEAQEYINRS
ncbi:molybdopterin molybdotransferase MoeA [Helicobacter turcicus]|uniref:Molybdopterin molybdenumtransferase n=1 Tax=Helicobacter turcicus TaxID=2867412 RepID=A0ABS7JM59_9HELI|nr:molybdopterin molybdotransferase MoeA [Helicobacter turcicus]MBX7490474.1 molybdopterin molybdotransferase MoeA [Helicobacter turcicus]MBX7545334.1 molybdopterin molybdotransferase MoeA [Helicobacter turcicus]